ncbi:MULTISPECIES: fasciclin domain-containing protein [unclassified Rhodosalinus]|uniref:fasciclin domain-containing protein n=1 Tax=unclassified Rhodosalinus TaxID=2630183 RepID=UPI00352342C1
MNRRFALRALAATGLAAGLAACAPAPSQPDIVGVAASNDQFSTLVTAVQAAGLVETLQGPGPFTLFAPTNAAFEKLPAGTVESLLQPENRDQLVSVLTYHVVPGAVTSDQLAGKRLSAETVQGQSLHINATGSAVHVENARVTQADISASNGVIHVIDTVLLPE